MNHFKKVFMEKEKNIYIYIYIYIWTIFTVTTQLILQF